jgi:ribonucleoside-diphosphate reductase beta chain
MRLYHKAKKIGVWDPRDIDLTQDKKDWQKLDDVQKEYMLRLVSQFEAGEEAVSHDILPLIAVMAREGRIEDEMYLSTFLWEEVKHVEFFRRFLDEVIGLDQDMNPTYESAYKKVLFEELPKAMNRLWTDSSPEAIANASVTYNMIIEGVLAETGYHNFYTILDNEQILPGLREGVSKIQRDESRHIGYGVYLLARLVQEDPGIIDYIQKRMAELQGHAMALIEEGAARYDHMEERPFGLPREFGQDYAMTRFQGRMAVIMRAKEQAMKDVEAIDYELAGSLEGSAV